MKQQLSLQFLKDLIDFNLLSKNLLIKNKAMSNTLTLLHLNKEFKVFINIVQYIINKKYDFIFILIEDPFLYQLLVKRAAKLNLTGKIPIVILYKYRNFDKLQSKKILTICTSNNFNSTAEEFMICVHSQNTQETGSYKVTSDINTIKSLVFFITLISNILK
jgi:hypothetical protein